MMTGTFRRASSSATIHASLAPDEHDLELQLVGEAQRGLDVARAVRVDDERLLAAHDRHERLERRARAGESCRTPLASYCARCVA